MCIIHVYLDVLPKIVTLHEKTYLKFFLAKAFSICSQSHPLESFLKSVRGVSLTIRH